MNDFGNQDTPAPIPGSRRSNLRADCEFCFGLCCTALYFSASEGFPEDKEAGQPCQNLQTDFRCRIHGSLKEKGLKGCLAFDCFGAGQKVSQITFTGTDWQAAPNTAEEMFRAFLIMRQLHEMLWYLTQALTLPPAQSIRQELLNALDETERLTLLKPELLAALDLPRHRAGINALLIQTSELVRKDCGAGQNIRSKNHKALGKGADLIAADLRKVNLTGKNLRGAYLIAADLRGANLSGTDVIGADFRDADIRGADFSQCLFLTQAQVNAAKGDEKTRLPPAIIRPSHW